MTDIFQECRERLDMDTAARHFGYEPNRAGFIRCPFHTGDKTPSLKIYPNKGGWHCFGCHRGGSVIDFTAELLNLSPLEAVKRLNADFNLGLDLDYKEPTSQERQQLQRRRQLSTTYKDFQGWLDDMVRRLNACFREGHLAMKSLETPADLDRLAECQIIAIREQARFEWLSDTLTDGTLSEQMQIFRERGQIGRLCNQILSNTPMKSGAA